MATEMTRSEVRYARPRGADLTTVKLLTGESSFDALAGIGVAVLAILGLAGLVPRTLASTAAITAGVALTTQGLAVAARYGEIEAESGAGDAELGGGVAIELLGGIAGIVLGILALLDIVPMTLLACAAIGLGATLLLGEGVTARVGMIRPAAGTAQDRAQPTPNRQAVMATAGIEALIGVGAIVLGVLALVGVSTALTLILIAFLSLGVAILLGSLALGGRMLSLLRGA